MFLDFRFEFGRYSFLRSHELVVLGLEPLVFGLKQVVSHVKALVLRLEVLGLGRGWVGFGLARDRGGVPAPGRLRRSTCTGHCCRCRSGERATSPCSPGTPPRCVRPGHWLDSAEG